MQATHMWLFGFPGVSDEQYWNVVHFLETNTQHHWPPKPLLWRAAYRDQEGCLRVAHGYANPTTGNFEVLRQALQVCGVASPAERALLPVTSLSSSDPAGAVSLPVDQMVVLQARYPQAGLAAYQQVMEHPAIAHFAPLVVVHAGGAEENGTVHAFNIFPSQDAATQASVVLGPIFAELHSPAPDRQFTGKLIDFRWFATNED